MKPILRTSNEICNTNRWPRSEFINMATEKELDEAGLDEFYLRIAAEEYEQNLSDVYFENTSPKDMVQAAFRAGYLEATKGQK